MAKVITIKPAEVKDSPIFHSLKERDDKRCLAAITKYKALKKVKKVS